MSTVHPAAMHLPTRLKQDYSHQRLDHTRHSDIITISNSSSHRTTIHRHNHTGHPISLTISIITHQLERKVSVHISIGKYSFYCSPRRQKKTESLKEIKAVTANSVSRRLSISVYTCDIVRGHELRNGGFDAPQLIYI